MDQQNISVVIRRRQPINISVQKRQPIIAHIRKHNINVTVVKNIIRVTAKLQGPPGPSGGGGGGVWSDLLEPTESPDGMRDTFSGPDLWIAGTLRVTLNGLLEPVTDIGSGNFRFSEPPHSDDTIQLWYQKAL